MPPLDYVLLCHVLTGDPSEDGRAHFLRGIRREFPPSWVWFDC
jgi:hypothetical protein